MSIADNPLQRWERDRAALSHDVLKNQLLPLIFKLSNVLARKVEDEGFVESFAESFSKQMCSVRSQIEKLCANVEDSLSPRCFFHTDPLAAADPRTMSWLPNLVHDLWVRASGLEPRTAAVKETHAKFERVASVVLLSLKMRSGLSLSRVHELRGSVAALASEVSSMREVLPYQLPGK